MKRTTNITQGPARIYGISGVSESSIGSDNAFIPEVVTQHTAGDIAQVKEQITDSLDNTFRIGLVVGDNDRNKAIPSEKTGSCVDRLTTGSRAGGG
jgi:hypothetical protein